MGTAKSILLAPRRAASRLKTRADRYVLYELQAVCDTIQCTEDEECIWQVESELH